MSFRKRDFLNGGVNFYAPVYKWATDINTMWALEATELSDLFEHIYYPLQTEDVDQDNNRVITITIEDCGFTREEIQTAWFQKFRERLVMYPFYVDQYSPGHQISQQRIQEALHTTLVLNRYKYKKLIETYGFIYDPISNYDAKEEGLDTDTPTGKTTRERKLSGQKVSYIKAAGVMGEPTITVDPQTGELNVSWGAFDDEATRKVSVKSGDDERRGKVLGTDTNGNPIANDGTTLEQKNYTTTMDNSANTRLHSRAEQLGDLAHTQLQNFEEEVKLRGEVMAGNPAFAPYTDEETFTNRKDEKKHALTRKGNIGVMTTQDMILQQRELLSEQVLDEFFKDLNSNLLLKVWY